MCEEDDVSLDFVVGQADLDLGGGLADLAIDGGHSCVGGGDDGLVGDVEGDGDGELEDEFWVGLGVVSHEHYVHRGLVGCSGGLPLVCGTRGCWA